MSAPGAVIFDILAKDRASQVFKHVGAEARRTGRELDTVGARGGSAMGKLAHAAKAAAFGIGSVAAVTGVVAVKMAANFEKQTSLLQTAAGETAAGLKIVRKGIMDIAVETGTTWENLSEGMYQVEKAGYRGAAGLKVLKAASQGAKEEGADLAVVTNAMTSIMASYHFKTDQSVQVMNALKTAAAGSKDTMQNFASSLSTVLPIASAAGIGFDQVGGAIAGLTRHGTSAAEATLELAFTIRNLQAPTPKAVKQMEQLGISSVDVAKNLGKRGLSGTLEYLVSVITKKMGPNGLILQDVFKKSASASADLQTMLKHMSPEAHKLADQLLANSINITEYRKQAKLLPENQLIMARQFATLAIQAGGFSDALRRGGPQATTMSNLLKAMLGGSTGLNTALQITGENQAYVNEETRKTAESLRHHSKEVEGWEQTQKLFSTRLDSLKQSVEVLGIQIGNKLMPYASKMVTWLRDSLQPGGKLRDVLGSLADKAKGFGEKVGPIFRLIGNHPHAFSQIAADLVIMAGVLKARTFITGLSLLKGGGGRLGGVGGGAAATGRPVPVFVTNPGFGGPGGRPGTGPGGVPVGGTAGLGTGLTIAAAIVNVYDSNKKLKDDVASGKWDKYLLTPDERKKKAQKEADAQEAKFKHHSPEYQHSLRLQQGLQSDDPKVAARARAQLREERAHPPQTDVHALVRAITSRPQKGDTINIKVYGLTMEQALAEGRRQARIAALGNRVSGAGRRDEAGV